MSDGLITSKKDLLNYLEAMAKEYRLKAKVSIRRNKHMNDIGKSVEINQQCIDAILVDYINYIGTFQGLDYGLYVKHLKEKE